MFVYNKDSVPTPCEPGVTRRILAYSDEFVNAGIFLTESPVKN